MGTLSDREAIRAVVRDYLEGMIYGQADKLRSSMHQRCMQAGHFDGQYEYFTRDEFIEALSAAAPEKEGTPIVADVISIDVTGDVAIAKVYNECLGTTFTDYLTLIRHDGQWQIVMKAFYDHATDLQD